MVWGPGGLGRERTRCRCGAEKTSGDGRRDLSHHDALRVVPCLRLAVAEGLFRRGGVLPVGGGSGSWSGSLDRPDPLRWLVVPVLLCR